jgi:hypothetical protein
LRFRSLGRQIAGCGPPRIEPETGHDSGNGRTELFAERRNGKEAKGAARCRNTSRARPTSFDEFAKRNAAVFRGEVPAPKV